MNEERPLPNLCRALFECLEIKKGECAYHSGPEDKCEYYFEGFCVSTVAQVNQMKRLIKESGIDDESELEARKPPIIRDYKYRPLKIEWCKAHIPEDGE